MERKKQVRKVRRAEMATTPRMVRKTLNHSCGAYVKVKVTDTKNKILCLICDKVIGEVLPKKKG